MYILTNESNDNKKCFSVFAFSVTIGEPGWRVAMDLDANQTYITTNSVNFSNCPIGVTEGVALRSGSSVKVSGMLFSIVKL